MSVLYSLVGFLILLGVLVFIHEWGHYAVARLFNIKVLRFSIGFGPVLWHWRKGETEWALSAIPLGGYVRMLDEREGPVAEEEAHRAFNRQPPWKRIAVVAAGPVINLLFAWWLFALVYWVGYEAVRPVLALPGEPDRYWIVDSVEDMPVFTWGDLQSAILEKRLSDDLRVVISGRVWPDGTRHEQVLSLDGLAVDGEVLAWLKEKGLRPKMPPLAPYVGKVVPGSPADLAGLKPGDRILAVDGMPVSSWEAVVDWVKRHPGKPAALLVERDGQQRTLMVEIGRKPDASAEGFLGVAVDPGRGLPEAFRAQVRFDLPEALRMGWLKGWQMLSMTLEMIGKMLSGEAGLQNLSGPVSIAQFSGQALASGWVSFVMLMGLISLSLGVLNLLPIPMLDGGHILFDVLEWIRGRPLPEAFMEGAYKLGLATLLMLTLLALSNDMIRLLSG